MRIVIVALCSTGCFLFAPSPRGPQGSQAEQTLYGAVFICHNLMNDGDEPVINKERFPEYRDRVANALRLDPNVSNTRETLDPLRLTPRERETLADRTLWQWKLACDAWFANQLRLADAAVGEEKRAAAQLTGDRRRLYQEDGWPTETASGSDKWNDIITSIWWSYGSFPNDDGEPRCWQKFYFKGDKVVRQKTEGLCH